MNYCLVMTAPFKRPLQYLYDSHEEAARMALTMTNAAYLGMLSEFDAGTELKFEIVPAAELTKHFDS